MKELNPLREKISLLKNSLVKELMADILIAYESDLSGFQSDTDIKYLRGKANELARDLSNSWTGIVLSQASEAKWKQMDLEEAIKIVKDNEKMTEKEKKLPTLFS